ncbi:MAG: hypothetical protein FP823_11675 [Rhodoferax sp.]|nr:hypothetical protein [Rhodoferax sp.]
MSEKSRWVAAGMGAGTATAAGKVAGTGRGTTAGLASTVGDAVRVGDAGGDAPITLLVACGAALGAAGATGGVLLMATCPVGAAAGCGAAL